MIITKIFKFFKRKEKNKEHLSIDINNSYIEMNEKGLEKLYDSIRMYIKDVEEVIDEFDYEEKLSKAYKGEMQVKVRSFLESTKVLFKEYIDILYRNIDEVQDVYQKYLESQNNNINEKEI